MYDAADDPYTYENSTVLMNKLDLRIQEELDAFEAEISTARAEEPLPEGGLDFTHYKAVHHHLFQDVYDWAGQVRTSEFQKEAIPFAFPNTSKIKRGRSSTICTRPTICGISMRSRSLQKPHISSPS